MTRALFGLFATLMLQASTILGSDTLLLPMEKVEAAGQECDTCFEPYQPSGGLFPLQFPCKHYFCVECLRDWISVQLKQRSNKLRCPMCNHEYCIDAVQESFLAHCERGILNGEKLPVKSWKSIWKPIVSLLQQRARMITLPTNGSLAPHEAVFTRFG